MTDNDPHLANGLLPGILTGLLATVAGAAGYGALIAFSGYEIGFAAIGVGLLVGLAMIAVRPTSPVLPPLAAFFSLVGAALGRSPGPSSSGYGCPARITAPPSSGSSTPSPTLSEATPCRCCSGWWPPTRASAS